MKAKGPVGRRYRFRDMEFWAENGMVMLEDRNTGEFIAVTRRDMILRAMAFNDEINKIPWGDEREEMHSIVQSLADVIREAKHQGDPSDPKVVEDRVKEIKRNRKNKVIMMPGDDKPSIIKKIII